jgi:hypothetical protein
MEIALFNAFSYCGTRSASDLNEADYIINSGKIE